MKARLLELRSARVFSNTLLIALLLSLALSAAAAASTVRSSGERPPVEPAPPSAHAPFVQFVENIGQFDPRARFQGSSPAGTLWLTQDALWITRVEAAARPTERRHAEPRRAVNLKLSFVGANPHPHLAPLDRQASVVHYYHGADPAGWHTHVPVWGGVRYEDLYPGVDLIVGGAFGTTLSWRLETRDDADLSAVRLRVEGAEGVTVTADHLHLSTALGEVTLPLLTCSGHAHEAIPNGVAWSQKNAPRNDRFGIADAPGVVRTGDGTFEISAPYARATSLASPLAQVNDPEASYFGAYLGGSNNDWIYDIALSGQGDILDRGAGSRAIWIVGWTTSSNFPTVPGSSTLSGSSDAFVTKLQRGATYVAPAFSVYLGGADQDGAQGIATDANENAYVTGWTRSSDFVTTGDPFDATHNGCMDAFVLKIGGDGTLLYASYLGGSHVTIPGLGDQCGDDEAAAIAIDDQGRVYLTGSTYSQDFPTTSGAYDTTFSNFDVGLNTDTFVVQLDPGAGADGLLYSTFIGGGTPSWGEDIAIDGNGNVYVTGDASGGPDGRNFFPTTPGAYDAVSTGAEAFVLKLNLGKNGPADLRYATFLGVEGAGDYAHGIALDEQRHVYVCGKTYAPGFPTTPGALDTTCGTDGDCNLRTDFFLSQLDPAGNGAADLRYSTFLGGDLWEGFYGECDLALGTDGDVYVTGDTSSTDGFPITPDAYDPSGDRSWGDAFVVRLRPQGHGAADLVYGTYVGGSYTEGGGTALALDEDDRVYVVGETQSSNFPTTPHALYDYPSGARDGFVFRLLAPPPAPDLSGSIKTVIPTEANIGAIVTYTVQLVNSGGLSTTVSLTDTLPAALLLQGNSVASAGDPPAVAGQTITWRGAVDAGATVDVTYAAQVTATGTLVPSGTLVPPIVNRAYVDDGAGNVYLRHAFVNGYALFMPLVIK